MSHTETKIAELQQAKAMIMATTKITKDQYSELLFHYGSQFAEHFSRSFLNKNDVCKSLLENKAWGFWPWFQMQWQIDDAAIIKQNGFLPTAHAYEHLKSYMIGDEYLDSDLYHSIQHLI